MKVLEEIKEKCCSHCEAECDGCWLKELIADYTTQVREEVVEEIRERLKNAKLEIMSSIDLYSYTDNFLYQVEKGRQIPG